MKGNLDPDWNNSCPLLSLSACMILFSQHFSPPIGGAAGAVDEESFISSFEDCKKVCKKICVFQCLNWIMNWTQGDNILRARVGGGAEQSACNLEHHWRQWGLETEDRGGFLPQLCAHSNILKSGLVNMKHYTPTGTPIFLSKHTEAKYLSPNMRRLCRWWDHC